MSDAPEIAMQAQQLEFDDEVSALLSGAGLPVSDLKVGHAVELLGVRDGERLIGLVGLEWHGEDALLRSLVVTDDLRGSGLGRALVEQAETRAVKRGAQSLYLLTTSAAAFFGRLGYESVPRTSAPPAIAASTQFSGLCPASSAFMCKRLAV